MPHVIRLRGPWEYEPLSRTRWRGEGESETVSGELPPPGKITMPADWGATLGAEFHGRVRYRRRFNKPTGLTEFSTVGLIVEAVDYRGRVLLNGSPLGELRQGDPPGEYDVTELLGFNNVLEIVVELPEVVPGAPPLSRGEREGLPGGVVGEVRLEIYEG